MRLSISRYEAGHGQTGEKTNRARYRHDAPVLMLRNSDDFLNKFRVLANEIRVTVFVDCC